LLRLAFPASLVHFLQLSPLFAQVLTVAPATRINADARPAFQSQPAAAIGRESPVQRAGVGQTRPLASGPTSCGLC
jgi:hypothetical protein